jgi:hypothetical protein
MFKFLKNVYKWRKMLMRDEDYDFYFLLLIMKDKIQMIHDAMASGHLVQP